ncbi:hypothetical protein D3C74_43120 [compost metagenome]
MLPSIKDELGTGPLLLVIRVKAVARKKNAPAQISLLPGRSLKYSAMMQFMDQTHSSIDVQSYTFAAT